MGGWLCESGPSKGVNVLAIFGYVVKKIEVFSEGKTRKKFSASGFAFERLTFLSKVENRLKRGRILCESFTQEKTSWILKERLNDGNLWFLPFSLFKGFVASSFKPKILVLIWSYSKCFGVRWRGFKRKTQACVAFGVELNAE